MLLVIMECREFLFTSVLVVVVVFFADGCVRRDVT